MPTHARPLPALRAIALAAALLASGAARTTPVSWNGPNNSYWDLSANWNPALPGVSDDVLLGAFNTELRAGTVAIQSLSGSGSLTLSGGTLAPGGASAIGALALTGGLLSGNGTLTVSGASTWSNGDMGGAGATVFNGPLAINGGARVVQQRSVTFGGATSWSDGTLYTGSGASMNNNGSFTDSNANNRQISNNYGGAASSFNNNGSYHKTGAGNTTINNSFNNSGLVVIDAGTLTLGGGGTGSGNYSIAAGATLALNGGSHSINTLAASGSGSLLVNGGAVAVAGAGSIAGQLAVSSGNFSVDGIVTAGSLDLTGGYLGGSGTLAVNGASHWGNGDMSGAGATVFNGALTVDGGARVTQQRSVTFGGVTTWSDGTFYTGSGAVMNNSGTFIDSNLNNRQISNNYGGLASSFNNSGTYHKTGVGNTTISNSFSSSGLVVIDAGTLTLGGGGASNGSYSIAAGATLAFNGGSHSIDNLASSGSGAMLVNGAAVTATAAGSIAGQLAVSAGSFSADGSIAAGSLDLTGGYLGGSGTLAVNGASHWGNGDMSGAGATVFNGALTVDGGARVTQQRSVTFAGVTTWSDGTFYTGSGAVMNNSGTFIDSNVNNRQISNNYGGADSSFNNSGTYHKTGVGNTTINNSFSNGGVVVIDAGTLTLGGGGNGGGAYSIAAGATLAFNGGNHAINGLAAAGSGTLLVNGGTVSASGAGGIAGRLNLSSGSFSMDGSIAAGSLDLTGGALGGGGTLTVNGSSHWANGDMSGTGATVFNGALAVDGGARVIQQRSVTFGGVTSWTGGTFYTGSGAVLVNSGDFNDSGASNRQISNNYGGQMSSFSNNGSYRKTGAGSTTISDAFSNAGSLEVSSGTLNLFGAFANYSSQTLSGGSYTVSGDGTLQWYDADIVTNAASVTLDGASARLLNAGNAANALQHFASNSAGASLTLRNGANLLAQGNVGNAGLIAVGAGSTLQANGAIDNLGGAQLQLGGGTLQAASIANAGTLAGAGQISAALSNSGQLRASGGTLRLELGAQGDGLLQVDAGATLQLGAAGSAGTLLQNGTLNLGSNSVLVKQDYGNANFGVGNAFDRHAGVLGSGQILAVAGTAQSISGAQVQNGGSAVATLALGTIRVGQGGSSASFMVNNAGSGATLRGALQTGGISNSALSGSGVTAQNWGPLAAGASSQAYTVHFNPLAGQVLSGQSIAVVNNFDNVAGQTLQLTGKAYQAALAQVDTPALNFGIVRVGDVVSGNVVVRNDAGGALTDTLQASIAASGAPFSTGGSASLAAGGAASFAVQLDTSHAGSYSGNASLGFTSHNDEMADLALAGGNVALSAIVNQLAAGMLGHSGAGSFSHVGNAYALDFGQLSMGGADLQAQLSLLNAVSGQADALAGSWQLGAGSAFTLSGPASFGGLAAGDTLHGLQIQFDGQHTGSFDQVLVLKLFSTNASDPNGRALDDIALHLTGTVVAVPEPDTYLLLIGGMLLLAHRLRRRS